MNTPFNFNSGPSKEKTSATLATRVSMSPTMGSFHLASKSAAGSRKRPRHHRSEQIRWLGHGLGGMMVWTLVIVGTGLSLVTLVPQVTKHAFGGSVFPVPKEELVVVDPPASDSKIRNFLTSLHAEFQGEYETAAEGYAGLAQAVDSPPELKIKAMRLAMASGDLVLSVEFARQVIATPVDLGSDKDATNKDATKREDERREIEIQSGRDLGQVILGIDALASSRAKEALAIFGRVGANSGPLGLGGSLGSVWALAKLGKGDQALKVLDEISAPGWEGALLYHHATLLAQLGDVKKASDLLARSDRANTPGILRLRARLKVKAGSVEEAKRLLQLAIRQVDSDLYFRDLEDIEAEKKLDLVQDTPEKALADGFYRIATQVRIHSSQDSLILLQAAIELDPAEGLYRVFGAEVFNQIGRYEEAASLFASIPVGSPYYDRAVIAVADGYYQGVGIDRAIEWLDIKQSTMQHPYYGVAAKARLFRYEERYEEAEAIYQQVFEMLPNPGSDSWELYFHRGMALERLGRWSDAEPYFLQALEYRPDNPDLLNYLGYSWVEQGVHLDKAEEMIRKAVKLARRSGYIVDSLGWVLYRRGRYEEAVRELEHAIQLLPLDITINEHLGDALWQVGRRREARFQWERALVLDPDEDQIAELKRKLREGLGEIVVLGPSAETEPADAKKDPEGS